MSKFFVFLLNMIIVEKSELCISGNILRYLLVNILRYLLVNILRYLLVNLFLKENYLKQQL